MSITRKGSSFLLSYGDYAKELFELKKLLQKTSDEIKACCRTQHERSNACRDSKASETSCNEFLEDTQQEVFEVAKELEEGAIQDKDPYRVTELNQIFEENSREFPIAVLEAHEDRQRAQQRHLEALKTIHETRRNFPQ